MGFLAGKRILITGLLSNRSIAYGIAKAMHREGAELAFTYQNDRFKDRVAKLAADFGSSLIYPLDVQDDAQITGLFEQLGQQWDGLDGLVHSIAFAPGEALEGDFLDGLTREAFRISQEVSTYSFPALVKAARPLMQGRNASVLTLSYLGAVRTMPNYNIMGLAKASLEASVRYLAVTLGPEGIRANAICPTHGMSVNFALPWPGSGRNWYRVTDTCNWAEGTNQFANPGSEAYIGGEWTNYGLCGRGLLLLIAK